MPLQFTVKVLIIMILTFLRTANTLNVILFDILLNLLQKGFFVFRALVLCVCVPVVFCSFGRIALTQQIKLSNHAWKNKLSTYFLYSIAHDTDFALHNLCQFQIEARIKWELRRGAGV